MPDITKEQDALPGTIEGFRRKYGRDPATDTEMEHYYGPMNPLPETMPHEAAPPGGAVHPEAGLMQHPQLETQGPQEGDTIPSWWLKLEERPAKIFVHPHSDLGRVLRGSWY